MDTSEKITAVENTGTEEQDTRYFNSSHRLGRISMLITLAAMLAVPIVSQLVTGAEVSLSQLGMALLSVGALFVPLSIVEVMSYAPYLGAGGTYLAFITGNIGGMKLPAAIAAVNNANEKLGSKKAEVIAILAVGASSIVTTTVVFLGMLFLSAMLPILQHPVLQPAFDNMRPALIGAFGVPFIIKSIKEAVPPLVIAFLAVAIMGLATFSTYSTYLMPVFMVISGVCSYFMYKKGWLGKASDK